MRKNHIIALAVLLITFLLMGILAVRFAGVIAKDEPKDYNTEEGISYLQAKESEDAAAEENDLRASRKVQTTTGSGTTDTIEDENFRAVFRDTLFCGDSLVKSIAEYKILDDSEVIAKVGGGTRYLKENIGTIVARNPQYLILHFGENELDSMERAPYFIQNYQQCIETLQKRLPNTKIFVDSIWPVTKKGLKAEPLTANISDYNKLLRKMCQEVGVTYVDYDPLFRSLQKNYYEPDGIHLNYHFYTEQYLPFLHTEVHKS